MEESVQEQKLQPPLLSLLPHLYLLSPSKVRQFHLLHSIHVNPHRGSMRRPSPRPTTPAAFATCGLHVQLLRHTWILQIFLVHAEFLFTRSPIAEGGGVENSTQEKPRKKSGASELETLRQEKLPQAAKTPARGGVPVAASTGAAEGWIHTFLA